MSKIAKLFRWHKKVDIKDGETVLGTVYLRLVGDSDFQEAKVAALKASKTLRIKLRNPDSEEHKSTFSDIESLTKEELCMGVTFGEIADYRDEALVNFPEKEVPQLPDNPTLEEQENYEEMLEKRQNDRAETLAKYIEKRSDERKEELAKLEDVDKLREMYKHSIINLKCSEEFTRVFREYQVYKGTYEDNKFTKLAFDSYDEFLDSAPQLKNLLLGAYIGLELSGEELKN
jgi:dsDNA-binding SOS-regulon protein